MENPRVDYENLYSEDYYEGRGVDRKLNYVGEAEHRFQTIRRYEWEGIFHRIESLMKVGPTTKWLDYGCGTGGFVEYLVDKGVNATGYEQGWCTDFLEQRRIPTLADGELNSMDEQFDVVTAIEVIEHLVEPLPMLQTIRRLLKPNGLLFLTTGNSEPFQAHLGRWPYITPEVHVSYFEPSTLCLALTKTGYRPQVVGYGPGWVDMYRFKILLTIGAKWRHPFVEACVPWGFLSRTFDRMLRLSAQPVGWADASWAGSSPTGET